MHNPSKGRPSGKWKKDFNFAQPLERVMSPVHPHEFGAGFDLQYKDRSGKVQARLDGFRPSNAAFLRQKHNI